MQILLPDWLSQCILSAIRVQWLGVVYKLATFFRFVKVLEEKFDANE